MKKIFLFLIAACVLASCNPNEVFSDFEEVAPDMRWDQGDKVEMKVPIEDANGSYKMNLAFRYIEGFQFRTMQVKVTEIAPDGQLTVQSYSLNVVDSEGGYIGDPALDIWDVEQTVELDKTYSQSGTYTYIIEHSMPADPVNYASGIGLSVEKNVG